MAIVKMSYTRDPIKIKEHLRYIVHRPGKNREHLTRQLFNEFDTTDKISTYERIDATKHPLFFKFIINLDPKREDTRKDLDLQHLTRKTLREMQRLIGREDLPFVAVIHDDHTMLRHIHAIALVQGKIAKADFYQLKHLWRFTTAEARAQRRSRDYVRERHQTRFLAQARVLYQSSRTRKRVLDQADTPHRRYRHRKPLQLQPGCHHCGYGDTTGIPSWRSHCPNCHRPLHQEQSLQLELSQQL
jgi:predicted Zn-ribbon and HTH transcriptional regulator